MNATFERYEVWKADVEFYVCDEAEPQTLQLGGIALGAGASVPSPKK